MDWVSLIASLFSKKSGSKGGYGMSGGTGGGASGWFSTSTAASGETGDIFNTFGDMRPVYNQGFLSSLDDVPVEKLAIVAGVIIVGAVVAFKVFKGR